MHAQKLTALLITVAAFGCRESTSASSDTPTSSAPIPAHMTASKADYGILGSLRSWDEGTAEAHLDVAKRVASRLVDFRLLRLETFRCGAQTHELAIYNHPQSEMDFTLIPSGTFSMGSASSDPDRSDDEVMHLVTLTIPFLMARTPVTQGAWKRIMTTPVWIVPGDELPIESASWSQAVEFCNRTGLTLPTEAQWEWACRAGAASRWCFGDNEEDLNAYAWYGEIDAPNTAEESPIGLAGESLHPVGRKKPNGFGLFDMHGSTFQWCADWYGNYPLDSSADPAGPATGEFHVVRGASSLHRIDRQRCAARGWTFAEGGSGLRPTRQIPP